METAKDKSDIDHLRRDWRFIILLLFFLAVMVKFPLRIKLREAFWDAMFYGTISLICVGAAVRIYRNYGKRGLRLITVILLCFLLSTWQIIDMTILRLEGTSAYTFSGLAGIFEPIHDGWAWYGLRFPSDDIMCHSLFERYVGNNFLAIAYDINRNATWFACGG